MLQKSSSSRAVPCSLILTLAMLVLTGCQSTPKIDWNSRIGNYTYNQAVTDLGPPDKTARLSDGKVVAEWIRHSAGSGVSFGVGSGFYGSHSSVGVGQSVAVPTDRDHVFRLVFGPDDKLASWSDH